MIQSRSVVGSVAGHGYYRPFLLEQLHQTLFIRRTGTGHDFKIHHTVQCFLITQLGESNSGDAIPLRIRFRIPKTDLTCDFRSGSRSITGLLPWFPRPLLPLSPAGSAVPQAESVLLTVSTFPSPAVPALHPVLPEAVPG